MKKVLVCIVSVCFLLVGCNTTSSSWAFDFVKYNNTHYIPTENKINNEDLGEKIGQVETFLDQESDSINLSSNKFAEGTEIYSIQGIDIKEEIAVVEKNGKVSRLEAEK
ncbi:MULTISPECIES: hypothetical protein [unclassified Exiguobacterium]|uniref:hypothetical protein n=1 Tax=unclassified Exiguobacterium TaxID=2644629 RepID=UPI001BE5F3C9|nr:MULTISPECIES: hypothetical protein [unclassified Exiguobacterium]